MKKFVSLFLPATMLCLAFTTHRVIQKTYAVKLGYTCKDLPVAVDSLCASYDGSMFKYHITYCSQAFTAKERHIKFTVIFLDKDGNILQKISTDQVLKKD